MRRTYAKRVRESSCATRYFVCCVRREIEMAAGTKTVLFPPIRSHRHRTHIRTYIYISERVVFDLSFDFERLRAGVVIICFVGEFSAVSVAN